MDRLDRADAEPGGQHPVERRRSTAALDMAELHDSCVEAGPFADRLGDAGGHAAEQHVTEPVVRFRLHLERAGLRFGALRDDDDRGVAAALVTMGEPAAERIDVEGDLGDEHGGRAARDAGVRGDPSRVAPHHLDHHHPVVALGGGVQAVDGVGRDLDGGVEAERHVGADDVVVDRLRHTDDRQAALLVEAMRDA